MSVTDTLLENNTAYAEGFSEGDKPIPPSSGVAVVACMDARIDVYRALGLGLGEAHVIRNAGGVVTDDAIRSLVISQELLGTKEIVLIHHTDCGMLTFKDDDVKGQIQGPHRDSARLRVGGPSPTPQRMCDSRSHVYGQIRSWFPSIRCVDSSTTSTQAGWRRSTRGTKGVALTLWEPPRPLPLGRGPTPFPALRRGQCSEAPTDLASSAVSTICTSGP